MEGGCSEIEDFIGMLVERLDVLVMWVGWVDKDKV